MSQTDDNPIILFADSTEVSLMPTITRCWTKIGQQRLIMAPDVRFKVTPIDKTTDRQK